MKKFAIIFGMIFVLSALITPAIKAVDNDVGLVYELPADNNAVINTDCQADISVFQYVSPVELLDHGDRCTELRTQCSGLGVKSPAVIVPYSNGDLTDNAYDMRSKYITLYNKHCEGPVMRLTSSSNGGIGY